MSAVPICVRMASHCSLLCHDRPMCSTLACLSGACLSGAEGRLLNFSANVSFLFTLLARAPVASKHTCTHVTCSQKSWHSFIWTDVRVYDSTKKKHCEMNTDSRRHLLNTQTQMYLKQNVQMLFHILYLSKK